jgi:hypothetical protein
MTTDDRSSQHATALDTNENSQLATSLEAVEVRLEFPLQSDAELATIRHRKAAEERRRHRTPRRINSLEQCEAALRDIHEDLNALELWSIHLRRWTKQLGLCVEVANQNRPDSPPTSQISKDSSSKNPSGSFERDIPGSRAKNYRSRIIARWSRVIAGCSPVLCGRSSERS